uniref:Uncharacterized protein n=1 Tax=Oryza glumipatula TaxID=40148 RepID=A0A0E0B848_9ORYZ
MGCRCEEIWPQPPRGSSSNSTTPQACAMDFVFVALSTWRMRAPAVPAWKRRAVWCRRCQDSRRCRPHLEAPAPPPSLHGSGRPLLLSPAAFRLDAPPATEREPRRTLGGRAHGPRLRRKKTEDALYLGPPVVMVEGFPALTHRSVRTTGMGYDWNHIQRVKYDGNTWVMLRRDRPKKSMCGMHEKCPCGCRISPKNTFCSPSCKVAAIQRGRSWQLEVNFVVVEILMKEGFPFIPDPDEQLPEVICARVTRVIVGDGRSAIPLRSQVLPSANNAHNCTCIMGEWCSVFCKRNGALGLLGCCPRLETVAQVGRSDRRRPKSNA